MDLQQEFNKALNNLGPFEEKPHIAVATSGGSDSLSLTFLAYEWALNYEGTLTALIVDHGLRPEAAEEAKITYTLLKKYHIKSVILKWQGEKPTARIQERARQVRYNLLFNWCERHHVLHLLVGHHQDDQRETFTLRERKDSGSIGLAGMSAVLEVPKVRLLRPLLKFPKSYLRSYLYNRNIPFIEDPSNNNPKYSRALLRQQELTSQEQIRANNLVKYYAKRRIQTENNVNEIVSQHITVFPEGYGLLEKSYYQALSSEHQLKILQRCIMTFGVGKYPPKRASLFCLKEKIGLTCTLHGCLIFNWGSYIGFARESEAIKEDFLLGLVKEVRWDDRFNISFRKSYQKMRVRALKEKGWEQLKKIPEGKILSSLPHPVRLSLPGLWEENHLICPLIPFASKFTRREEYVISFSPRYPLTRFTFTIV